MSRGGGRGGKRVRAQIRAKGEDEDGRPLTLAQPRPEDFRPPPLYPPLPSTPQPFSSQHSPHTAAYLSAARLLSDFHAYSGYRLTSEQAESVRVARYSDRYRRSQGQRGFLDECPQPSMFLFPAELQRWDRVGSRGSAAAGAQHKWPQLASAEALQAHLDRLTVVRDDTAVVDGSGSSGAASAHGGLKEERKDGSEAAEAGLDSEQKDDETGKRRGAGGDADEDEDEKEEEEQREDDEDDDMGGGDYTDRYQEDDDGEGDDVFGEDDGEVF